MEKAYFFTVAGREVAQLGCWRGSKNITLVKYSQKTETFLK
jgi:hypothetical protein